MYLDNKVYLKLILQTNYDEIIEFEEKIVSFPSVFHVITILSKQY